MPASRAAAEVRRAIAEFCGSDPGRSVALRVRATGLAIDVRGDVARPAASMMKVPLVMALFDRAADGTVSLDTEVSVAALGQTRYVSILAAFDPDRTLTLREIAALALIVSDNPATEEIRRHVSFADVEAVLRRYGCSPAARMAAGFRDAELGAANRINRMTAKDAVLVLDTVADTPRYAPILTVLQNNLRGTRLPALLDEDVVVGHKTGTLAGVVNDAGVVSRAGKTFTLAVMCDEQPDPLATSRAMAELARSLCARLLTGDAA